MSGGILLPGNATTAQVLSGQTFSSGAAGFNATGTYEPPTYKGQIRQIAVGNNSETGSFESDVLSTSEVIFLFATSSSTENEYSSLNSISGLGATWTEVKQANTQWVESFIYQGTPINGSSTSISLSVTANEGQYWWIAIEVPGTLTEDSSNSSTDYTTTINTPANGIAFIAGATYEVSNSAGYGTPVPLTAIGYAFLAGNNAGQFAIQLNTASASGATYALGISGTQVCVAAASFSVS